jgi:spermidine/putrescine transport system substrate-binding protein
VRACFRIFFTSLCAVFLLGACAEQSEPPPASSEGTSSRILTFYNWEEYIGSETIAEFERETGIRVNLILFEDDEEIIGAMQSGFFDGDIVVVSESLSREMVGAKLLQEIDYSRIPNARHIDPRVMTMDVLRSYAVPYLMGTTGFIVNTKLFPGETWSWGALWDERARGRIGMLNNPFEVAAVASKLLGYEINPTNEQLPLVRAKLLEQKPLIAGYFGPMEVVDKMVSGELLISQVYSGDALMAMERNPDLEYVVPVEGCVSWMDDFVIPKNARNSIEAHRFIDFIHRPEIIGRIASEVWYATPNLAATPFIDSEVLQSEAVFPPAEVQAKCQHFGDMGGGDEVRGRLEVWAELTSD